MIDFIKKMFNTEPCLLIEGKYADSYQEDEVIQLIKERYKERWMPEQTPQTHPAMYYPFDPPKNWRYDPFYEEWIKVK